MTLRKTRSDEPGDVAIFFRRTQAVVALVVALLGVPAMSWTALSIFVRPALLEWTDDRYVTKEVWALKLEEREKSERELREAIKELSDEVRQLRADRDP